MILKALINAGAISRDYSGMCARRGCTSTATDDMVPEAVLRPQTGHAPTRSSRVYIKLAKPTSPLLSNPY
jgi:hypothetical protein